MVCRYSIIALLFFAGLSSALTYDTDYFNSFKATQESPPSSSHFKDAQTLLESVAQEVVRDDSSKSIDIVEKLSNIAITLKALSTSDLLTLYKKLDNQAGNDNNELIKTNTDSKGLYQIQRRLFLETLPLAGSRDVFRLVEHLFEARLVSEQEMRQLCASLPTNIVKFEKEMSAVFFRIIQLPHVLHSKSAYLLPTCAIGLGKLIRVDLDSKAQLASELETGSVVRRTNEQVEALSRLLERSNDLNKQVAYIEALGHATNGELFDIYYRIIKNDLTLELLRGKNQKEREFLRTVAIYSLSHSKVVYDDTLISIYEDKTESSRIRIAAFTSALLAHKFSDRIPYLKKIKRELNNEKDERVYNFVHSAISSIAELSNAPLSHDIRVARLAKSWIDRDNHNSANNLKFNSRSRTQDWTSFTFAGDNLERSQDSGFLWSQQLINSNKSNHPSGFYASLNHVDATCSKYPNVKGCDQPEQENIARVGYLTSDNFVEKFYQLLRTDSEKLETILRVFDDSEQNLIDALTKINCDLVEYFHKRTSPEEPKRHLHDRECKLNKNNRLTLDLLASGIRKIKQELSSTSSFRHTQLHQDSDFYKTVEGKSSFYDYSDQQKYSNEPSVILFSKLFEHTSYASFANSRELKQTIDELAELCDDALKRLARGDELQYVKLLVPNPSWNLWTEHRGTFLARHSPILVSLRLRGEKDSRGKLVVSVQPKLLSSGKKILFAVHDEEPLFKNGLEFFESGWKSAEKSF